MKLYQLILIVLYVASGIYPLITLFKGKLFEMEKYLEYKHPYSVQWVMFNAMILFIILLVWLCNKAIDILLLIDWNLQIF